ncbi:MAG: ATP-binding protein, partial [Anaerolineae bacterium]|nr:ATP-binding protein [Anaerolineae bacterium]
MMDNPYNPLQPGPNFFGREETFAFFRQNLVGTPHDHALVLIGRRGLGKSALLRQLQGRLDERYRVCTVALGTVEPLDEYALITALADSIRLTLEWAGASTYRLPDLPETVSGNDLWAWFRDDYLNVTLAALRLRFLVLALDDAHLLLEAQDRGALPTDLWTRLGDLLAVHERLDLVIALDAAYEARTSTIPLLSDPGQQARLAELLPAEAERLVREPVESLLAYEDGLVEAILAQAGGHPFLIHSICRLLVRRSEERHHSGTITQDDLDAVGDAVLDQSAEVFEPLWADLTHNERITLTALVRLPDRPLDFDTIFEWLTGTGYSINKTQLAAALRGLDYQGAVTAEVTADADSYRLSAGLIGEWVRAHTSVEAGTPARLPRDRAQIAQW